MVIMTAVIRAKAHCDVYREREQAARVAERIWKNIWLCVMAAHTAMRAMIITIVVIIATVKCPSWMGSFNKARESWSSP